MYVIFKNVCINVFYEFKDTNIFCRIQLWYTIVDIFLVIGTPEFMGVYYIIYYLMFMN